MVKKDRTPIDKPGKKEKNLSPVVEEENVTMVTKEVVEEVPTGGGLTELTPAQLWEQDVKRKLNEYLDNFLSISTECNMATKYYHPVSEQFETHTEFDMTKSNGAELRIVFNFANNIELDKLNYT